MEFTLGALIFIVLYVQCAETQCPASENGSILSYGDSCQYKCRCLDNKPCDNMTGECPTGCALGWMGPGCQYVNFALYKPATQSVDPAGDDGGEKAVDGDENTCIEVTSTTNVETIWSVDLGEAKHVIGLVIIVPAFTTLDAYTIVVSNETYGSQQNVNYCYWQQSQDMALQKSKYEITCFQPLYGQFITILKQVHIVQTSALELCEVQVYGGRELAFRRPSLLSSIVESSYGPDKANDGTTSGGDILRCSFTQQTTDPMWQVDLGQMFTIYRIVIHSSEDDYIRNLISGFVLTVSTSTNDEPLFQYTHGNDRVTEQFIISLVKPVDGRYITVQLPGTQKQLVLCEVEVFGDCPVNHCKIDCSDTCWCNTTITGDAQVSGECPYGCSDEAEPSSSPSCDIEITNNSSNSPIRITNTPNDADEVITTTSNDPIVLTSTTTKSTSNGPVLSTSTSQVEEEATGLPEETPTTTQDGKVFRPAVSVLPENGRCPPQGDILSFGDKCQYSCHCRNNQQCQHNRGTCPDGFCAPGWLGRQCQYGNIVYTKTAFQESTQGTHVAGLSTDGINHNTCSWTLPSNSSWWAVDLGQPMYIDGCRVNIPLAIGELQQFWPFLNNFVVFISNDSNIDSTNRVICYEQTGNIQPWYRLDVLYSCFRPVWGRYLFIQQRENKGLHMCEVTIPGGRELSFRKATAQSSTRKFPAVEDEGDVYVIDEGCISTDISTDPWWMMDLGKLYSIQRIQIHSPENNDTRELLVNFRVIIAKDADLEDITFDYSHEPLVLEKTIEVVLSEFVDGRFVQIQLPGEKRQLVLCGVDVFGDVTDQPESDNGVTTSESDNNTGQSVVSTTKSTDARSSTDYSNARRSSTEVYGSDSETEEQEQEDVVSDDRQEMSRSVTPPSSATKIILHKIYAYFVCLIFLLMFHFN